MNLTEWLFGLLVVLTSFFDLYQADLSCPIFNGSSDGTCYLDDRNRITHRFGTKTTFSENQRHRTYQRKYKLRRCKPIMFYMIARHAIRYPDEEDIREMQEILPRIQQEVTDGQGTLCAKDLNRIKEWKMRMKPEDDNNVSESGRNETIALAMKYRRGFKDVLDPDDAVIEVGVTNKIRTTQTAEAFIQGLKNEEKSDDESDDDEKEWNPVLREKEFLKFHDNCKKMVKKKFGKLPKPKAVKDFTESELVRKLGERIQRRLGLTRNVDFKLIKLLKAACSFEYAIYNDAPWCAAFAQRDLEVLEYYEDLEDYLEDAYGSPLYHSSCQVIADLTEKITESVRHPKPLRSYLYFTHAGALKRLWPGLGLFKDNELLDSRRADDGFCSRKNRYWRSSLNTPFGANFVAALFKCKKEGNPEGKFKVLTLVNGVPTAIGGCGQPECALSKFASQYNHTKPCNLQEICTLPGDRRNNDTEI